MKQKNRSDMKREISLGRSVIITDEDQPSYVKYGIRELAEYLEEITGRKVPVRCSADTGAGVEIIAGAKRVQQFAPDVWNEKATKLGAEGFLIRMVSNGSRMRLIVSGATPQGTKYGLVNLMKQVRVVKQSAFVSATLDIASKPSFSVRGMHLNGWAFNYPYTFRCWKEADWKRYADMLTYQGANLFFIWPFMEIMPVPLSAADESYLREVRRVVDYAQKKRGMEVWIFQSANRIALNDCGVRDPRHRPYWVVKAQGDYAAPGQADLNPADPKQFAQIMKSRETIYRLVDNADGYCTIDCDPGGWEGSPFSDYLKILKASRASLDRHTTLGKRAKLIHWHWYGWSTCWLQQRAWWQPGADQRPLHAAVAESIRAMKAELLEPWWLIVGQHEYLPACATEGVLGKTVYMPYGAIEGEPSRPGTQINFQVQRKCLDRVAGYPGLAGLMGNAQTPLLQFPHVSHFLNTAWSYNYRKRPARESLRDLAARVYPEHSELLDDCWMALASSDRAQAGSLSRRLERLIGKNRIGRPGILGRKLFPTQRQIAEDLAVQLKVRAALKDLSPRIGNPAHCAKVVEDFLDAALTWDRRHGWSAYWRKLGTTWALVRAYDTCYYSLLLSSLRKILGGSSANEATIETFFAPIKRNLIRKHDPWIVANCAIEPLKTALLKK